MSKLLSRRFPLLQLPRPLLRVPYALRHRPVSQSGPDLCDRRGFLRAQPLRHVSNSGGGFLVPRRLILQALPCNTTNALQHLIRKRHLAVRFRPVRQRGKHGVKRFVLQGVKPHPQSTFRRPCPSVVLGKLGKAFLQRDQISLFHSEPPISSISSCAALRRRWPFLGLSSKNFLANAFGSAFPVAAIRASNTACSGHCLQRIPR